MQSILYISVAIIAISFFILVLYLIPMIKSLTKNVSETLQTMSSTLEKVEKQVEGVTKETEALLHKTNAIMDDVQEKSMKLNTVFDATQEIGKTIQNFNSSLQGVSNKVIQQVEKNQEKISQIVQWGNIAVELKEKWDEIRERKKQKKQEKQLIEHQLKQEG